MNRGGSLAQFSDWVSAFRARDGLVGIMADLSWGGRVKREGSEDSYVYGGTADKYC